MPADPPQSGSPKRLILIIAIGAMIPVLASGYLLYSRLGAPAQPAFEPVADYLAAPETVPERVGVISTELLSLQITRGGVEFFDASGQRHSLSPNGEHLERGGTTTATRSFALAEVDFASLPAVLAQATSDGGGNPNSATAEVVDGTLSWRIAVWADGGAQQLVYPMSP